MNRRRLTGVGLLAPFFLISLQLLFLCNIKTFAKGEEPVDQVLLSLRIQQLGSFDIPALLVNEHAYLPVTDLFDLLKIKNNPSRDFNTIKGYIIDPKAMFEINYINKRISWQGKVLKLNGDDLIRTEGGIYMKSELYGQIFGLDCLFKFRSLSIILSTKLELPAIRDLRLTQMRNNLSNLRGEKKADTTIARNYPLFDLGVADWSVTATQDNSRSANTRATLNLGGIVAGGEAIASLSYNKAGTINNNHQYYQWRYVNNENASFKQITAGRIFTQPIASVFNPVNGIQISNTPTTYRRSFGTYRIDRTTEPGWLAELYVNNSLVNYVVADASGFYRFDVPLVYGNSSIKIRIYGPWGEERSSEENISIPFNFLPVGQFEYTMAAGIVDNSDKDILTRAAMNYGINSRITVGAGTEYLTSANAGRPMAFVNSSVRLFQGLLLSGQYTPRVNAKGVLNYHLPGNVQLNVNYTNYEKEQSAIMYNYREERKVELSFPIKAKNFNAYSRISFNQFVLPKSKVTNAQFMTSASLAGIGANLSTNILYTDPANAYIYSNLSLTFRLPMNLRFSPHFQYEYNQQRISMMKAEMEKRLGSFGFANITYEKSIPNKITSVGFGLRMNFSFAQTFFGVTQVNHTNLFVQSANGSLLYNSKRNSLSLSNETNVGEGGLTISAFLDLNRNGHRDLIEPRVPGLKLKLNGGRLSRNNSDSTISVSGLEAYTNYIIQLDPNSFDNISWRLNDKSISIAAEPNHYRLIEVPISVVAEASGTVYMNDGSGQKAYAGMIVEILDSKGVFVAKTLTEEDGYYSFFGLAPGKYLARPNTAQLQLLNLKTAADISFNIKMSIDGDIVDALNFELQSKEVNRTEGHKIKQKAVNKRAVR
jgi:hypothetical protein